MQKHFNLQLGYEKNVRQKLCETCTRVWHTQLIKIVRITNRWRLFSFFYLILTFIKMRVSVIKWKWLMSHFFSLFIFMRLRSFNFFSPFRLQWRKHVQTIMMTWAASKCVLKGSSGSSRWGATAALYQFLSF